MYNNKMSRANQLKLVVGASAGGHANELLILLQAAKDLWPIKPQAYVTTMEITAQGFVKRGMQPAHVLGESDRRKPLQALAVGYRALRVAIHERPDIVITTGSMPLAIFCIWSKLLGAKIVWIDSVAQVEKMSTSGRVMRRIADLCLVQWPELPSKYPGVEYSGEVL